MAEDKWSGETVEYVDPKKLKDFVDLGWKEYYDGDELLAVYQGAKWRIGIFPEKSYHFFTVEGTNVLLPD